VATKLDEARRLLATRLQEIEEEREQLIATIAQLDRIGAGAGAAPSRTPKKSTRKSTASRRGRRSGARKRAPRGKREEQLLSSISAHPDFRVADHAREVGVKPQQLYPILNRLKAENRITKKDDKYTVERT